MYFTKIYWTWRSSNSLSLSESDLFDIYSSESTFLNIWDYMIVKVMLLVRNLEPWKIQTVKSKKPKQKTTTNLTKQQSKKQ